MKAKTKLILAIAAAAVVLLAIAMIFFPKPLTEKLELTDTADIAGGVMLPTTPDGEVALPMTIAEDDLQRLAEEIAADKVRYAGRFSVVSYDAPVYYLMLTTDTAHLPTFAVDCEGYLYINGDNVGGNRYRISSGRLYALLAELHYTAQE